MGVRRRDVLRGGLAGAVGFASGAAQARQHDPAHRRIPPHHLRPQLPAPLVVIDPGHGGKDPGCIGLGGIQEKQVVLAIALELRRQLQATRRCQVVMTRSTDVFIPLDQRVALARQHRAAVFVSLHANASPSQAACGACVYRFGLRASDTGAAAEARWENRADQAVGQSVTGQGEIVIRILGSLMRRETMLHSAALQRDMVEHLAHHTRLTPRAARHARFAVLTAPDIASVLVETGFLTNRHDAMLLRSRAHHVALAGAMRDAVERYVSGLPRSGRGAG